RSPRNKEGPPAGGPLRDISLVAWVLAVAVRVAMALRRTRVSRISRLGRIGRLRLGAVGLRLRRQPRLAPRLDGAADQLAVRILRDLGRGPRRLQHQVLVLREERDTLALILERRRNGERRRLAVRRVERQPAGIAA